MVKPLALVLVLAACQGKSTTTAGDGRAARDASMALDVAIAAGEDAPPAKIEEPEPPDPGKLIADLGAIPAWQAVIDRARLLARRGQRGTVYGRIGPTVLVVDPEPPPPAPGARGPRADAGMIASPYVWLVDDTEGNGALGIRVLLGKHTAKEGDRVALAGAWALDNVRRWYWKVDTLQAVPAAASSDVPDQAPIPSHAIRDGNLAAGARTISVARDNDAVYFQLVGPSPANDGDGWAVADELGDTPFALLTFPGERGSYGGQDLRAPDERWQLKRGQTYWVRIGKIRKRVDKPALIRTVTAPVRVK
ncbi:MAG: hypothetical protein WKG01_40895 [Kofleriaceae bacterium]